MNTLHKDRRTRLTKSLIRRAFTDLLAEKPLQRITVREVCQRAGVNRSTIYAHYTDLYDLLTRIEEEMLEDFQQALAPLLDPQLEEFPTPLQITTEIYRCLKENADVCTVTLGENGDKDFALRLLSLGREICLKAYAKHFPEATTRQLEYFYAFASGGHMELLRKWVEEGMATSAEEMAQLAENIMPYGIGFLQQAPL